MEKNMGLCNKCSNEKCRKKQMKSKIESKVVVCPDFVDAFHKKK